MQDAGIAKIWKSFNQQLLLSIHHSKRVQRVEQHPSKSPLLLLLLDTSSPPFCLLWCLSDRYLDAFFLGFAHGFQLFPPRIVCREPQIFLTFGCISGMRSTVFVLFCISYFPPAWFLSWQTLGGFHKMLIFVVAHTFTGAGPRGSDWGEMRDLV